MSVAFLAICVHFIDRQADYMNRLDFCWKRQLMDEQEEANTTRTVNKMLLRNILPNHVGEQLKQKLAENALHFYFVLQRFLYFNFEAFYFYFAFALVNRALNLFS